MIMIYCMRMYMTFVPNVFVHGQDGVHDFLAEMDETLFIMYLFMDKRVSLISVLK